MNLEYGVAALAGMVALKAIELAGRALQGVIDRRNGTDHERGGTLDFRLRAIETSLNGLRESLQDISDRILTPMVTTVAVLEHRVVQLEERRT